MKLFGIFKGLKGYVAGDQEPCVIPMPDPDILLRSVALGKFRAWEASGQGGRKLSKLEKSRKLRDLEFEQLIHIWGEAEVLYGRIRCSAGCGYRLKVDLVVPGDRVPHCWMCWCCVERFQRLFLRKEEGLQ